MLDQKISTSIDKLKKNKKHTEYVLRLQIVMNIKV